MKPQRLERILANSKDDEFINTFRKLQRGFLLGIVNHSKINIVARNLF